MAERHIESMRCRFDMRVMSMGVIKMMFAKRSATALAALMMSTGLAAAAPAVVRSDLNLRSGPGTEYPVVASMPAGAQVDVGGCTGSWCAVAYGGQQGYASGSYLAMGGAPGVAAAPGVAYEDDYDDYYPYYGPSYSYYGPG